MTFPSENGPAFKRVKEAMDKHYGREVSYQEYTELCKKTVNSNRGKGDPESSYFESKMLEQDEFGNMIYGVRLGDDTFVAAYRKAKTRHISDILPRDVLLEHFDTTLNYMTPTAYVALADSKKDAEELCGWPLKYKDWISLCNQILAGDAEMLDDWDGNEEEDLYAVTIKHRTFAVIWDNEINMIVGFEDPDILGEYGLSSYNN